MTAFATTTSEQARNAERMSAKRRAERDIGEQCDAAEKLINWPRRLAAEKDILLALKTYFPDSFTNPFSRLHVELVEEILHRAKYGGDQAIAAPRGEGKTTLATRTMLLCVMWGLLRFPVIGAATRRYAVNILDGIKYELEANEILRTDYPLACLPFAALERAAQRAAKQLYHGEYTEIEFGAEHVVMPKIPRSNCSGSVMMMFSMDSAVRGINVNNQRPDFILVDDPETREAAHSITQRESIRETIRRDLAGLGGQGRRVSRLILTTLQHTDSVSADLTDPKKTPAFNGKRYRAIEQWPTNADLWQEYIAKRQAGMTEGTDLTGRGAHAFYVANREAMDAGSKMLNEHRYDAAELPDGTQMELSALQAAYNFIADNGMDAFSTEYQNDPPTQDDGEAAGITSQLVRSRLSGLEQCVLPLNTTALTIGIDLGKHYLNWVVTAWQGDAVGSVVDYGMHQVNSAIGGNNEKATEQAILSALHDLRSDLLSKDYRDSAGNHQPIDVAFIDSGNWNHVVYQFLKDVGGAPFYAIKGSSPYHAGKPASDKRIYQNCHATYQQQDGVWLYWLDTDHWKRWVHERFLTQSFDEANQRRPGSLALFVARDGQPKKERDRYSHQICAEVWCEEFIAGKGVKKYFKKTSAQNHDLDATYMACAAASLCGVRLIGGEQAAPARRAVVYQDRFTAPSGMPFLLTERT